LKNKATRLTCYSIFLSYCHTKHLDKTFTTITKTYFFSVIQVTDEGEKGIHDTTAVSYKTCLKIHIVFCICQQIHSCIYDVVLSTSCGTTS